MSDLVSIIMPVFNAEKSVSRAIDSVLNQTYKNWELIIVNDGSTDNTNDICTKYKQKDSRVKLVSQNNSGVAIARQTGMSYAKGEYIIHLDSDDYMESIMLNNMISLAKSTKADIVICDFNEVASNNSLILRSQAKAFNASETIGGDFIWSILDGVSYGALWNKLIKRSLFDTDTQYFYKGINYSEDVLALAKLLYGTQYKIIHLPKALYYYTINEDSITRKWTNSTFKSLCLYYDKISEILPDDPRSCQFKSGLKMGRFSAGFLYGFFPKREISKEFAKVRHIALSTRSIRWKIGYTMIDLHLYSLARLLLAQ